MNVNQSSVMRVLRAALFGFVLFLIGYMIPHPGALATTDPQPTINSVPGGFTATGQVTINTANLTCTGNLTSCSYPLTIQARTMSGNSTCTTTPCTAFNSNSANFTVTWYDQNGATPWSPSPLYASGTLGQ
jgi:hypothetical protein